jgi:hypothetical protein
MPEKPFFSISVASSMVAFLRPGTAARLSAGIRVILLPVYSCDGEKRGHHIPLNLPKKIQLPQFMPNHKVAQIAYHVRDIRIAASQMHQRFGAGPFFISENIMLESATHRGKPTDFVHSSAYGQWGDVMVELVRQEDDSSITPFRDMFSVEQEGLHHTAIIIDSFEDTVKHFEDTGFELATRCRTLNGSVEFGFIDAVSTLGHMIEIYEGSPGLLGFYQMVKDASLNWDGRDLLRE